MSVDLNTTESPADLIISSRDRNIVKYSKAEWKRAIMSFLNDIWSQLYDEADGCIIFGEICLSLGKNGYSLSYPEPTNVPRPNINERSEIHAVTSDRDKLELGLARFARNSHIKMLVIEFPASRFMLWKGDKKTDLHYTVVDRTF